MLALPLDGAVNQPTTLTLKWHSAARALSYWMQASNDSLFSTLVIDDSTLTDTTRTISSLNNLTTYYWRVKSKNIGGESAYSKVSRFTTIVTAPEPPLLALPLDGAANQPTTLTLNWQKASRASSYWLQVATDSVFSTMVVNDSTLTDTTRSLSSLSNLTTYYWRVKSKNVGGESPYSEVRRFTTIIAAPEPPLLALPLDGAVNQPTTLTLKWSTAQRASSYWLQVATDSLFSTIVVNDSVLSDTTKVVGPLFDLTTYYWRVKSRNVGGESAYSEARRFTTIVTVPETPLLALPLDGAVNQPTTLTLKWHSAARAISYWLQASTDSLFSTLVINDSTLTDTSRTVSQLANSTKYRWHVNAKNTYGKSGWSFTYSFTTEADTLPPSRVTDFVAFWPYCEEGITSKKVRLVWTAPGDDGSIGRGSSYEVRYSLTQPAGGIPTEAWFDSATAIANVLPPKASAEKETLIVQMSQTGLYFFGMRALDEVGNKAALSNLAVTNVVDQLYSYGGEIDSIASIGLLTVKAQPVVNYLCDTTYLAVQISQATEIKNRVIPFTLPRNGGPFPFSLYPIPFSRLRRGDQVLVVSSTNIFNLSSFEATRVERLVVNRGVLTDIISPALVDSFTTSRDTVTVNSIVHSGTGYKIVSVQLRNLTSGYLIKDSSLIGGYAGTAAFGRIILLPGDNTIVAEAQDSVGNVGTDTLVVRAQLSRYSPPLSWSFRGNTGKNASIAIPFSINPMIGATQTLHTGDAVGVFFLRNDSLICAGYSLWEEGQSMAISAWGDDDQTTMKDGFASEELIRYKIWDAQAGKELGAIVQYQTGGTTYTTNGIYVLSSLVGFTNIAHSIRLPQGWNMISSFLAPKDSTLDSVFVKIKPRMVIAKNGAGKVYWPALTINTIGKWQSKDGYQLYMQSADTLTINGDEITPQQVPLIMSQGWSLVSYLRNSPMRSDSAVTTLGGSLVIAKNGAGQVYWPALSINTIGNMKPGQGYQMYLSSGSTLTYPANAASSPPSVLTKTGTVAESQQEMIPEHYRVEKTETGSNATLAVKGIELKDGDEVGVRGTNGKLVGSGVVKSNRAVCAVWGDNALTEDSKEGALDGESLVLTVWSRSGNREKSVSITSLTDGLTGQKVSNNLTYLADGVWEVEIGEVKQIPTVFSLEQNYPNPFNPSTVIRYGIPKGARVRLEVYNVLGQKMMTLVDEEQKAGYYEVVFEPKNLSSGVYLYTIRTSDFEHTKKLILLR
ncbi:MAG: T9SS type A sorting domain-containing protein [Ignavibacteria bacterium]|nr:T9SS type A sorting domain-containing protein [Ignavibacteria bacterium]